MNRHVFSLIFISTNVFAQDSKYLVENEVGGNMGVGGFVLFIVVPAVFAFVFGTSEIRKGILGLVLMIVCVCSYMYGLIELAKYVQYHLSPVKHGIGLVFFLVFILGWFVPIWIWSKVEK